MQSLPDDIRAELLVLLRSLDLSKAALLWRRHVGGELPDCLATIERLRAELRDTGALRSRP